MKSIPNYSFLELGELLWIIWLEDDDSTLATFIYLVATQFATFALPIAINDGYEIYDIVNTNNKLFNGTQIGR